ncbi:MAG: molybdenum-dependent transcriptional regulator [Methanosarcinaceae archaeon]|nr:molybdenum-dependent transcriptional regulator [Methanosarcinaceae archaeon]
METRAKVWLTQDGIPIMGAGKVALLKTIDEERSLQNACKKMDISYKHAWLILKKINERVGHDVVRTVRGGRDQGTFLTEHGKQLIEEYERSKRYLSKIVDDDTAWENIGFRITARNKIIGEVVDVEKGDVASKVKIAIQPTILTSLVTAEAVDALDIKEGDEVYAIIKSTEVLIGKFVNDTDNTNDTVDRC